MMTLMRSTTRLGQALQYAANNHDLMPTAVLRAAGLSPRQVAGLEADHVIERIMRGLYRAAGSRTPTQDIAAAVSRHGRAVASHTSALFIHGLDVAPPDPPHITLPAGSGGTNRLGVLHRSPLDRRDRTRRQRIPVTTLARSLVDSAQLLSVTELAAAVNEAVSRKMVTVPQILDTARRVEAAPGRIGSGRLRAVLETWTAAIQPDSVAEAAAIRRIRDHGLPAPVTQHKVFDDEGEFVARLDMAWPDEKVGREYDSVRWHRPDRIEPDEIRTQRLESLGWRMGSVFRYHLPPAEVQWLAQLGADLRDRRRDAS